VDRRQWELCELVFVSLAIFVIVQIAASACQRTVGPETHIEESEVASQEEVQPEIADYNIPDWNAPAPGPGKPGIRIEDMNQEALNRYFPAGTLIIVDQYLGWREADRGGYQNLILWGMAFARGDTSRYPTLSLDPCMRKACELAWGAHCIDEYLAAKGSPLAGYGISFMREAWINGVSPTLMVGLTAAETTFATNGSTVKLHNAFCMKGPHPEIGLNDHVGEWLAWPDWASSIVGAARFLGYYWPNAQAAYNCRGYCEGNPPSWITTVETIRLQIEAVINGK